MNLPCSDTFSFNTKTAIGNNLGGKLNQRWGDLVHLQSHVLHRCWILPRNWTISHIWFTSHQNVGQQGKWGGQMDLTMGKFWPTLIFSELLSDSCPRETEVSFPWMSSQGGLISVWPMEGCRYHSRITAMWLGVSTSDFFYPECVFEHSLGKM